MEVEQDSWVIDNPLDIYKIEHDITSDWATFVGSKDLTPALANTMFAINKTDARDNNVVKNFKKSLLDEILDLAASGKPTCAPTIIVPSAKMNSIIKLDNAATFIRDGVWMDPTSSAGFDPIPENRIVRIDVTLPISRRKIALNITDQPLRTFMTNDSVKGFVPNKGWSLVCAVFCSGTDASDFTQWPFASLSSLFQHAKPFYLTKEGQIPPPFIKKTNTKCLTLSSHQRHKDPESSLAFLRDLEVFLNQPRSNHLVDLTTRL